MAKILSDRRESLLESINPRQATSTLFALCLLCLGYPTTSEAYRSSKSHGLFLAELFQLDLQHLNS